MRFVESYVDALKRPRGLWVLASNAIPVIGVAIFGWQVLPLLVFYWIENVVVGAINFLKILATSVTKPMPEAAGGVFLAAFFVVHYGLFCFVHGMFVFAIFTMAQLVHGGAEPTTDSFDLLSQVGQVLTRDSDLLWSVAGLIVVRAGEFLVLWVGVGRWRETDAKAQMMEPYGRILVLHATIVIGALPVIALGQPMIAVLILALLKTGLELGLGAFKPQIPEKSV